MCSRVESAAFVVPLHYKWPFLASASSAPLFGLQWCRMSFVSCFPLRRYIESAAGLEWKAANPPPPAPDVVPEPPAAVPEPPVVAADSPVAAPVLDPWAEEPVM